VNYKIFPRYFIKIIIFFLFSVQFIFPQDKDSTSASPAISEEKDEKEYSISDYFVKDKKSFSNKNETGIKENSDQFPAEKKRKKRNRNLFFSGKYFVFSAAWQNERLLEALENKYSSYSLGKRDNYIAWNLSFGFKLFWRTWSEINAVYFDRKAYSYTALSHDFIFTFFYTRKFPVSVHFKAGIGYGILNPAFPVDVLWDPFLKIGLRFKFRIWKRLFTIIEYENAVIIIGDFKYGKGRNFREQSRDISKFLFGIGYKI